MKNLIRALICGVVFAAVFTAAAPPASATSCSEYIAKRNETFDRGKKIREAIAKEQKEIAIAQQGVDVLSGEALAASKKALDEHQGLLKWYEQNLAGNQKTLKFYDDKVAQCRNGGAETTGENWMGTWDAGAWVYTIVSNGTGHIKYAFHNTGNGNDNKGTGGCATHGEIADCSWVMQGGGMRAYGDEKLTLSGGSITAVKTLTLVTCIVSTPDCETAAAAWTRAAKGRSETTTWQRKK
jgi:hypothetical protein